MKKHDTHGSNEEEWVGFDLDGTLAKYDGWKGIDHIGEPVESVVLVNDSYGLGIDRILLTGLHNVQIHKFLW